MAQDEIAARLHVCLRGSKGVWVGPTARDPYSSTPLIRGLTCSTSSVRSTRARTYLGGAASSTSSNRARRRRWLAYDVLYQLRPIHTEHNLRRDARASSSPRSDPMFCAFRAKGSRRGRERVSRSSVRKSDAWSKKIHAVESSEQEAHS